jgi:glycerol uptake operon antiterminator
MDSSGRSGPGRSSPTPPVRRRGGLSPSRIGVLFILGEDIFALQESVAKAHGGERLILAHVDLIKGIGRDEAGVRFLARDLHVDGILTTRANLIGPAKREGLIAVQRLFVLDSESLEAGLPTVERAGPTR